MSSLEKQCTPDITLTSTKLKKMAAISLIIYSCQLLSYWDVVQMLIVIQFQTFYNGLNMLMKN